MRTIQTRRAVQVVCVRLFLGLALSVVLGPAILAQPVQISHFVAPSYPGLARSTMVSGQAALNVTVDKDGSVASMSEGFSTHPLFAEGVKACVGQWRFQPDARQRKIAIVFYYGFSGNERESNPATTVTADFEESTVHVYITTDPAPTVHP